MSATKFPGLVIEIHKVKKPEKIFVQKINRVWPAGDVTRIRVLMEHDGIFLDNDPYMVGSLDCLGHVGL